MKKAVWMVPVGLGVALLPVAHHIRKVRIERETAVYFDCDPGKIDLEYAPNGKGIFRPYETHPCEGHTVVLILKVH